MQPHVIEQQLTVSWNFPVIFTEALFDSANPVLVDVLDRLHEGRRHRAIVFCDQAVAVSEPRLVPAIQGYFAAHGQRLELSSTVQLIAGGEAIKNDYSFVERTLRLLLEERMDRHSYVIVIGGGAVLDAVGFAAAQVHRGLRLIRVPTTVLGQNDAGVGVKNGVNFMGGKNAIGTFAPPFAVLNDFAFLRSLPQRDWLNGVAEAFKVAIIKDRAFFAELCAGAERFPARDDDAMRRLVIRCAELHLEHIRTNGDPFEYGRARPLDFGHWSAHKLELLSQFRISHGEAVASGVALDSFYAARQGWITQEECGQIVDGLKRSGFRLWFEELGGHDQEGRPAIFEGLREFQEHLGGELCVTFPQGLGARFEVHEINLTKMEQALLDLREFASR